MSESSTPHSQIRGHRRVQEMTQEALADAAGLSVTTVRKAEQGGEVNTRTLHQIAQALSVTTTELYADRPIMPHLDAEPDHHAIARLRAAITPPIGLAGVPLLHSVDGPVDIAAIESTVAAIETSYRGDLYDDVAELLPAVIGDAHRAVAELDSDAAYTARAKAMQMAGRYLTQVRQLDAALAALRASIRDAAHAGDRTLAAIAINGQGWALTRQGRLEECERLCTTTADEVEPRMSTADPDQLAAWGNLLFRAAAAAVRNNRSAEADELMRMASSAAAALGREHDSWATFGPLTVHHKLAEFALLRDQPDVTLELAEHAPDRRRIGNVTPINAERHRLDVAHAHVLTRDIDQATAIMAGVMRRSPEWMRRQNEAYRIVTDICAARPRTLTDEQAALAAHLNVAA